MPDNRCRTSHRITRCLAVAAVVLTLLGSLGVLAANPASAQIATQVDSFFIGHDGRPYVAWRGFGGWMGPAPIGSAFGLAPPGSAVTAARQTHSQLDLFFVGYDGRPYVAWLGEKGHWFGPAAIGSAYGLAPPGAAVAAVKQTDDQLDLFFVGHDGRPYVAWVSEKGNWSAPAPIGSPGVVPAGASLAAMKQAPDQLDLFFVGHDGRPHVATVTNKDPWVAPAPIGSAYGLAPPGSAVTVETTRRDLNLFFIGHDGRPYTAWVAAKDRWSGPLAMASPAGLAPPGSAITSARPGGDHLDLFFLGNDGRLYISWVTDYDHLARPGSIGPASAAPVRAGVASGTQPLHAPAPPPPPPEPALAPPTLTVHSEGSGHAAVFTFDGSGFGPFKTVTLRVVDDAYASRTFQASSDRDGKLLPHRQSIPCISGLTLHFSAADSRPSRSDLTGVVWSNTVTMSCP
ncbi:MAG: hypothetical protein ACRD12_00715 [Acidimicrobiales bacterium]